jgi:radical SAM superfamily enzyme YgiQ (UPF0313 family)
LVIPGGLSLAVFNEEMIDVVVEHGLDAVYFPLESGSKYVQEHVIKKRINLDKAIKLISYAKGKKLFTGINIVLGTPGETKEMMMETHNFIKQLPVDWIAFFQAFPYPETEMTRILIHRGVLTDDKLIDIWDSASQGFKERPFDTEEITGQELSELVYDFNIELNFFNNYNIRTGRYDEMVPKLDKIIGRYQFHVVALACRAKCLYELGKREEAISDIQQLEALIGSNNESKKMANKYKQQLIKLITFKEIKGLNG